MTKHIIEGYICRTQYGLDDPNPQIEFTMYKPMAEYRPITVVVREHSFEVEVPDDFDPRPAMVAALEEQKRIARETFAAEMLTIDKRINELLAIEHTVTS